MKKIVAQQGDLILEECIVPKAAKKVAQDGSYTVLKGEGTNTQDLVGIFEIYELDGVMYLNVDDAKLVHSEHGTEIIPKKTYRRIIEREFNYEEMEARNTQD